MDPIWSLSPGSGLVLVVGCIPYTCHEPLHMDVSLFFTFSLNFGFLSVEYATDKLWIPSSSPFKSNKVQSVKRIQI